MAGSAIERDLEMFRTAEIHAAHIFGVTAQTARDDLFRGSGGEGENARLGRRLNVLRARSVAAFATGRTRMRERFFVAEMRVAEKFPGKVGVARLARVAAGIVRGCCDL